MTNTTLFEAIASYGQEYRKRHLGSIDPDRLSNNLWPALDFFLSRVCFQGRRDTVSEKVYHTIIQVLEPQLSVPEQAINYSTLRQQAWKPLEQALRNKIGKGHIGKARDVKMVLSVLDFIGEITDLNIVKYSVEQIEQCHIGKHYVELQASQSKRGITQVGPKVAALYLRDLVSLYSLDDKVMGEEAYCLQPVDTWVRKLAYRLEIVDERVNDRKIQQAIVELCKSKGVSPVLFNQGAWYISYNAFDIVLELLDSNKP